MKNSIKRAQSQARLSFAERENFRPKVRQLKKALLTLVALLALTAQAWAEEKMVTINSSTLSSGAVTATGFKTLFENIYVGRDPATITTSEGVITKLVIKKGTLYANNFTEDNVGVTPGTITYGSDEITVTDINAESVTLSRKGSKNWSPSSVDVYYAAPAASSGPEVAWDKAKNSGSFTMPGGNVTLEPEYYPQAALTAAPTAINDVPATTDGAIVEAGTVATIGETTTAQGTVMYHVSPSPLDDAALQALAADQWTADVPTAADLAQGQAYVYYYVRGNDGDTDDEIFSDGDILAANALTVTIAAEPTYAVTFAEGTEESDKWTASPAADVKKGQTVTVTYTGTKKVIGVKAEKKAAAAATISFTVMRATAGGNNSVTYTVDAGTTWQQFIESGNAPASLSIGTSGIYSGKVCHDMNNSLQDCGGTLIANVADKKRVKISDAIIDGATYGCSDYLGYEDHD